MAPRSFRSGTVVSRGFLANSHKSQQPALSPCFRERSCSRRFHPSPTWGEAATENYPQDARLWDALAWAYKIRNPAKTSETFARGESLVYRNSEASHRTVLSLPFRGRWRVMQGNGGDFTHRGLSARFAWDFEAIDESGSNRSNAAPRGTNERYLSFGQDVLAPADGRVIAARDGASDKTRHITVLHCRTPATTC
jgi:hypothetical protein